MRLTTRYREDDFVQSLMGTIHETGHARFEQNLPRAWLGQPIGVARSYGIHESQSLSFEMQLARSRAFVGLLAPLLAAHFGAQPAFEPDNLYRLLTRVQAGPDPRRTPTRSPTRRTSSCATRSSAPLIEGEIEVEDIPALWDEKMQSLLGLDTRGNYRDGCMQDVHWTRRRVRLFPELHAGRDVRGAVVRRACGARCRTSTRGSRPAISRRCSTGSHANIWSQASRWETPELVAPRERRGAQPGALPRAS